MKEIYTAIRDAITANVTAIRWVDFDLGQLEQEIPPVSWPCALVQFQDGLFVNLAVGSQQATLNIKIRIAHKVFERTHSKTNASYQAAGLAHLDVINDLHDALEGLEGTTFTALNRQGFATEPRADLRVYSLIYQTVYRENKTSEENKYTPWGQASQDDLTLCVDPVINDGQ